MSKIAFQNRLTGAAFTDVVGVAVADSFNLGRWNDTRYPMLIAPAAGLFTVEADLGVAASCDTLILGANRYEASGYRFANGSVQVEYWNGAAWTVALPSVAITAAVNEASYHEFAAVSAQLWRLVFSGLATAQEALPDAFLGSRIEFANHNFGADGYDEVSKATVLDSELGRIYETLQYRRLELSLTWGRLLMTEAADFETFKLFWNQYRIPFWIIPDDADSTACYLMRQSGKISVPRLSAVHKTTSLKLIEAI